MMKMRLVSSKGEGLSPGECQEVGTKAQSCKGQQCCCLSKASGRQPEEAKGEEGRVSRNGLMFVDIRVNGKPICAFVNKGAIYNFVAGTKVERLGLSLEK